MVILFVCRTEWSVLYISDGDPLVHSRGTDYLWIAILELLSYLRQGFRPAHHSTTTLITTPTKKNGSSYFTQVSTKITRKIDIKVILNIFYANHLSEKHERTELNGKAPAARKL